MSESEIGFMISRITARTGDDKFFVGQLLNRCKT